MFKSAIVMTCAVTCAVAASLGVLAIDKSAHSTPNGSEDLSAAVADAPETTASNDTHVTAIPKATDGHFWANATVNDKAVRFLVDTGATVVVLTQADAERLGVSGPDLIYDHKVVTAMGPTTAAAVTLSSVGVGQSTVRNVPALIIKQGSTTSLLGMSYLGRLSRFEATPSSLILHP